MRLTLVILIVRLTSAVSYKNKWTFTINPRRVDLQGNFEQSLHRKKSGQYCRWSADHLPTTFLQCSLFKITDLQCNILSLSYYLETYIFIYLYSLESMIDRNSSLMRLSRVFVYSSNGGLSSNPMSGFGLTRSQSTSGVSQVGFSLFLLVF